MCINRYSFLLLLVTLACKEEAPSPDPTVVSRWVLDEVLSDPGDGSGTFQAVESNKVVVFLSDAQIIIYEGSLCELRESEGVESRATYSQTAGTIAPENCDFTLTYTIVNDELVISYPCIEPCAEKYRKLVLRDDG